MKRRFLIKFFLNMQLVFFNAIFPSLCVNCRFVLYTAPIFLNNSFVGPEVPKARINKPIINFITFVLLFVENCLKYGAKHDIQQILIGFETILNQKQRTMFSFFLAKNQARNGQTNWIVLVIDASYEPLKGFKLIQQFIIFILFYLRMQ